MVSVVIALKRQKRKRNRVKVFLDSGHSFELAKILATKLSVDQELSDDDIAELKIKDEEETAYQQALRLIAHRQRSEHELRLRFNRNQVPSTVQGKVLARLRQAGLVDDHEFADTWVENRRLFRPRSAFALRMELREKGVAEEIIESALEGYDDEVAAYQAARKGARRWRGAEWKHFQRRLGAYLARRGFKYSTISTVVSRVWHETTGVIDESEVSK